MGEIDIIGAALVVGWILTGLGALSLLVDKMNEGD